MPWVTPDEFCVFYALYEPAAADTGLKLAAGATDWARL
jgi:hypothetical protein